MRHAGNPRHTNTSVAYPRTPLAACALPKHGIVGRARSTDIVSPWPPPAPALRASGTTTRTHTTDLRAVRTPSGYSSVIPTSNFCCSLNEQRQTPSLHHRRSDGSTKHSHAHRAKPTSSTLMIAFGAKNGPRLSSRQHSCGSVSAESSVVTKFRYPYSLSTAGSSYPVACCEHCANTCSDDTENNRKRLARYTPCDRLPPTRRTTRRTPRAKSSRTSNKKTSASTASLMFSQ